MCDKVGECLLPLRVVETNVRIGNKKRIRHTVHPLTRACRRPGHYALKAAGNRTQGVRLTLLQVLQNLLRRAQSRGDHQTVLHRQCRQMNPDS